MSKLLDWRLCPEAEQQRQLQARALVRHFCRANLREPRTSYELERWVYANRVSEPAKLAKLRAILRAAIAQSKVIGEIEHVAPKA